MGLLEGRLCFRPVIPKTHQVGFREDCDIGVAGMVEMFDNITHTLRKLNIALDKGRETM